MVIFIKWHVSKQQWHVNIVISATLINCKVKQTSLRFDAKLKMLFDARIIRILRVKHGYWFRFLQVIED